MAHKIDYRSHQKVSHTRCKLYLMERNVGYISIVERNQGYISLVERNQGYISLVERYQGYISIVEIHVDHVLLFPDILHECGGDSDYGTTT